MIIFIVDGDASGSTATTAKIDNEAQTSNGIKGCLVDIPMPGTDDNSQYDKSTSKIPMPGNDSNKLNSNLTANDQIP